MRRGYPFTNQSARAIVAALLCAQAMPAAQPFNAPQPIRHKDVLHLNESSSTGRREADGSPEPVLRPAIAEPGAAKPPEPAATPDRGTEASSEGSPSAVLAKDLLQENIPVLKITEALNQALIKSPRVSAVRAQLEITKALYVAAQQMPNPVLLRDEAPIAEQNRRFGVQTTYDPPWKIAFRLLAAKQQVKATKLDILNTLWLFRSEVRRIYTECVVAQETYQTLVDLAELSRKLLEVSQKRFQAGDVPELDVLKARLATSQADIDRDNGGRRVIRARQQLNVILGQDLLQPIKVPRLPPFKLKAEKTELLPDFAATVPPMKDFIEQALANRLELRLIKQQVAVNNAQLYNAIGNIIPDPIVSTGNSAAGNPPTGPKLRGFFVSLNIELPVLTYSQGDIARLKATIKQLYAQRNAQRNQIIADVSSAYNNLLAARERIRVYQSHVLFDSEEVARLARRSYEVGQSDITATLAAQQANVQVKSQYLDAVQAYQQSFTDLEQSIGEPLQ